jgi:aspartate/glutamate racemase
MKRIGLLGGMSWESSAEYYRLLNHAVRDRLGGLHSADCVMHSIDFTTVEVLQREDRWDEAARLLTVHAEGLERAGAQCLVLCTNTMHKVADQLADRWAQAILLGCTEIDLLVGQDDAPVPVFDTTRIHSERIVDLALG